MSWLAAWEVKLAAALAVILAVVCLWGWGHEGHQKAAGAVAEGKVIATQRDSAIAALEAFKAAQLHTQIVLQNRIDVAQVQLVAAKAEQRRLNAALKAAPQWSDSPLPDGVWRALTGAADPTPSEAGPAPGADPGPDQARAEGPVQR